MIKMKLIVIFLLLANIRAQPNSCSCSCCRSPAPGQSCTPVSLSSVNVPSCTLESCLGQCRATHNQCQGNTSADYISAQCLFTATTTTTTTIPPPYTCRCDCCSTGSITCTPFYVGNTRAYLCQTGSCSIACEQQYPTQCRADQTGVTQGTCTDFTTTTSTATTITMIGPWLGNTCKCAYYPTGFCGPDTSVGVTSASSCSSDVCTQACRNRYPSLCVTQTTGTCISDIGAKTYCGCQCCGTNGCINYRINTNESCTTCDSICRYNTPCVNTNSVTVQTCSTNNGQTLFSSINTIFIIFLLIFFCSVIN